MAKVADHAYSKVPHMFFALQAELGLTLLQAMVLPTGFQFMDRGTHMVKGKHESFRVSKTGKMAVDQYLA